MDLASGIVALVGAGLLIASAFFRKPDQPLLIWNPKHWVPAWKQKERYRPPGYWLMLTGLTLFLLGTAIVTFVYRWDFH